MTPYGRILNILLTLTKNSKLAEALTGSQSEVATLVHDDHESTLRQRDFTPGGKGS